MSEMDSVEVVSRLTDYEMLNLVLKAGSIIVFSLITYAVSITWAVKSRPRFDQITAMMENGPYSKDRGVIFEKLLALERHTGKIEEAVDRIETLMQRQRPPRSE